MNRDFYYRIGKEAAENYLNGNVPLNESISKVAATNNLNRHQIKRACEFANHIVTASLYKHAEGSGDAYVNFPIARVEDIVSEIKKVAMRPGVPDDYDMNFIPGKPDPETIITQTINQHIYPSLKVAEIEQNEQDQRALRESIHLACSNRDELIKKATAADFQIMNTGDRLYREIVNALKSGKSLENIESVVADNFKESPRQFQEFWKSITTRLQAEGLLDRPDKDTDVLSRELYAINHDHDVSKYAAILGDRVAHRNKCLNAAKQIDNEADLLSRELQKQAVAGFLLRKAILPAAKGVGNLALKGLKGVGAGAIGAAKFVKRNPGKTLATTFYGGDIVGSGTSNKTKYL